MRRRNSVFYKSGVWHAMLKWQVNTEPHRIQYNSAARQSDRNVCDVARVVVRARAWFK